MLIGICDDNAADVNKIRFALEDVSPDIKLRCFDSGGALLNVVKSGTVFDLVFLDIFLSDENGMETAGALREMCPETEIVFCTTSRDHAVEAFRVQAADYLVKPYSDEDIVKAFARANVRRGKQKNEGVVLFSGRRICVFRPNEVIMIESDRHYTCLTDADGEETRIHLGYSEVLLKFPKVFIELRRGCSVNMSYISEINSNNVLLTNGESYTIAHSRLDQVIGSYTKFITET